MLPLVCVNSRYDSYAEIAGLGTSCQNQENNPYRREQVTTEAPTAFNTTAAPTAANITAVRTCPCAPDHVSELVLLPVAVD